MWKGAWLSSVWKGHGDVLRVFVEAGVDVDERDDQGGTLLLQDCWQENPAAVRALCENGANILAVDESGRTPLINALGSNDLGTLAIFRSHVLHNRIFTHPHTDSVPNLNLFVRDKVGSASFLLYGIEHPLSKWEVREYMDVVGCVRNGVLGLAKKYDLEVDDEEERRCGLRAFAFGRFPLDLYRWLLFWETENGWTCYYSSYD